MQDPVADNITPQIYLSENFTNACNIDKVKKE
jgi:hypothetical protein